MPTVVKSFDGEYDFLSNFYEGAPFEARLFPDEDSVCLTGEHGFQAYKAFAMPKRKGVEPTIEQVKEAAQAILDADTPGLAKKAGRTIKIDPVRWDTIKDACMRKIVFEKFAQNTDLRFKLLETGACMLVEGNTWQDYYWGRCEGRGQNRLGAILMEVRGFFHYANRMGPVNEAQISTLMGW